MILNIKNKYAEYKWFKIFNIETFFVPNGTDILKKEIFYGWKHLKLIIVPPSVKKIDPYCFENCIRFEEIEIPKNCSKNGYNLKKVYKYLIV